MHPISIFLLAGLAAIAHPAPAQGQGVKAGIDNLEDAFVHLIGTEEGLSA